MYWKDINILYPFLWILSSAVYWVQGYYKYLTRTLLFLLLYYNGLLVLKWQELQLRCYGFSFKRGCTLAKCKYQFLPLFSLKKTYFYPNPLELLNPLVIEYLTCDLGQIWPDNIIQPISPDRVLWSFVLWPLLFDLFIFN